MNKVSISKVKINEINDIHKISLIYFHNNSLFGINYLKKLIYDKNCVFVKILLDKKIVGFLISYILIDHIDIYKIAIDKEYKRHGYGTMLINYLFSKKLNIFAEVGVDNMSAIKFYKNLNFITVNKIKNYYDGKMDCLLMKYSTK